VTEKKKKIPGKKSKGGVQKSSSATTWQSQIRYSEPQYRNDVLEHFKREGEKSRDPRISFGITHNGKKGKGKKKYPGDYKKNRGYREKYGGTKIWKLGKKYFP